MSAADPLHAFLRACAHLRLSDAGQARLREAATRVEDWSELTWLAEEHGLAPLVRQHVKACGVVLPERTQHQLTAMAIRHRDASRAHAVALLDIVDTLDAARVPHVILKGAVLAFDVYPRPELRPRKDIDLLVHPADGSRAVDALRAAGFADTNEPVPTGSHHHLPALQRERDGYRVAVEVHVDAISHDQPDSLTLTALSETPRLVTIEGREVRAFGHLDMLRHLTCHLLEPGARTRLVNVVDVIEYAACHAGAIDWARLTREQPRTVNTIALLDYLVPLPEPLQTLRAPAGIAAPEGVGQGFPLLSTVRFGRGQRLEALRALLYPSEWWMRAYYGVPAGRALAPVRWTRHVWRLAHWGLRRTAGA